DARQAAPPRSGPPQGDRTRARARALRRQHPARGQRPRDLPGCGHREAAVRRARRGARPGSRVSAPGFLWTDAGVAAALGVAAPGAVQATSVSTDTREIQAGALFVALKGERFDAHAFLAQAKERGAVA